MPRYNRLRDFELNGSSAVSGPLGWFSSNCVLVFFSVLERVEERICQEVRPRVEEGR